MPQQRRRFLGQALAASLMGTMPPLLRQALAVPAHRASGTLQDVQHVVILMQENRSFDHYFGTLPGVRGFGERFTIPLQDGRTVWQQHNGRRTVMPYHLDQEAGNAQCALDLPHTWPDAQAAWNDGRMAHWPRAKTDASMAYYTRRELPFQFALADAFTLCDAYHCSLQGGTNPNRLYLLTGTNDPAGASGGPAIDNRMEGLGPAAQGFTWTTYAERLEQAGVRWKVYQDMDDNYDCNLLTVFRSFREAHLNRPHPLADKGLSSTLRNASLQGLKDDVLAGRLPQVSWIVPPRLYCEHPGPSTPVQGGAYTQMVLEALLADPAVWGKTVLLQMYDENDAFFDHAPPPAAPALQRDGGRAGKSTVDYAAECHSDGRLYGLGPRVPMLVISPWSKGGWVNSQVFDHTSVLRLLEARFGVHEPNISPWRRAVCGDLTSCFDFRTPDAAPPPLEPRGQAWADAWRRQQRARGGIEVPPEGSQDAPRQPAGERPSRALPYRLELRSETVPAQPRAVSLEFINSGAAGAVFHVYDKLHLERIPRRYTVEAGKSLSDLWTPAPGDLGKYDLWVLGPNGFHRHLQGSVEADTLAMTLEAALETAMGTVAGGLRLSLRNGGAAPCEVALRKLAYGSAPVPLRTLEPGESARILLPLDAQRYWYDYSVQCGGWMRRFAGRLETGQHGVSDPAMGT
ncbi:phospholipase C, phosphocholine-specific [Massilia sp. Root351]|jgi:phospholipase C|uniref:phosphocholine-specific phospholipase C n=1 Tax=Massilia sp. Root351 TaxID=1736522 RepID=UPI000708AA88|nr:phospholipase C, phosphocholine-specific [Massilia sp. Root351]KQV90263.1 phospholipase C, phosphocholine-specific [Massilia sp. Root351]